MTSRSPSTPTSRASPPPASTAARRTSTASSRRTRACRARSPSTSIKIGDVIGDGEIELKDNQFASGSIHILANFPQLTIIGNGKIEASEIGELSTTATLTINPTANSTIAQFVQLGSIEVEVQKFPLIDAKGELNLVPPTS